MRCPWCRGCDPRSNKSAWCA